ncbi:hypothetical protein BKA70DRAFT_1464353 [Coprinopsis sp. MPI-PUGE-AT-0042]|nr:hypothetical protein BKA70DRAFT_1464353 [Coprinopsis sp. MPI-PUGE-AT-0042]
MSTKEGFKMVPAWGPEFKLLQRGVGRKLGAKRKNRAGEEVTLPPQLRGEEIDSEASGETQGISNIRRAPLDVSRPLAEAEVQDKASGKTHKGNGYQLPILPTSQGSCNNGKPSVNYMPHFETAEMSHLCIKSAILWLIELDAQNSYKSNSVLSGAATRHNSSRSHDLGATSMAKSTHRRFP